MTLKKYVEKRRFQETPEPRSPRNKSLSAHPLSFCVQKHWATHLHYDFRLEHRGVLLSWAVPKGPSLNPSDKRLAIAVEDHPLEYRHFEGTIPPGHYGAGEVKIWDEGTYGIPRMDDVKAMEKAIDEGLKKGHLEFELFGEKLKGTFALIRMKNSAKNWLLVKKCDQHSLSETVEDNASDPLSIKEEKKRKTANRELPVVKPMLATLIEKPFNDDDWIFEIKFDGYRALAFIQKDIVDLRSRNELSFNQKFPSIAAELKKLKVQAILDGEIVILDKEGRSRFQLMQNYQSTHQGTPIYFVFDLLFLNGEDLRDHPLLERKQKLKELLAKAPFDIVKYSDHVEVQGINLFHQAEKRGLEGVIGKNSKSPYVSVRSKNWVKIKTHLRQEAVIGGFTEPRGARKNFGALLLGVYKNNKLISVGHTGSGFNSKSLQEIYDQLIKFAQKECPFESIPKTNAPAAWVKPKLVCEVSFQEWTADGKMRQAIFQGLRTDKDPRSVVREFDGMMKVAEKTTKSNFTNREKIYWPRESYTKGDLLTYYREVSSFILPYLKSHPVMLHRFPDGIEGNSFYQKDVSSLHLPAWMQTISIAHENEDKPTTYLLLQDLRSLEYALNLGTIEFHPYLSKAKQLDKPDYLVIDLDPEDISFDEVILTAQTVHQILEKAEVDSFCKTSGGRGLHVYIPLNGKYDFDQSKQFGELIALIVHQKIPEITSLKRSPKLRQKKVYLDVYQNREYQSVVAPYSVRGRPLAPVSTPLEWNEVVKGLEPTSFNISTLPERLQKKGDLFKGVRGKGCDMKKALQRIATS